jgi:hypothetical protein
LVCSLRSMRRTSRLRSPRIVLQHDARLTSGERDLHPRT